jgi:hypothetical protein
MELLQNSGYKPEIIMHERDFLEFKLQVESIIELCQDGEFSLSEVFSIVCLEWILSMRYKEELWEELDSLEGEIIVKSDWEKELKEEEDAKRATCKRAYDNMESYYKFLDTSMQILREMPDDKEYQKRRIVKIKQQITGNKFMLPPQNTDVIQTPKEEYITLPPVFNDVLKEGLLENTPVNGKYAKMGDKKDMDIIKHIIDHSAYADTLTPELYMQYIHTGIKPQTIGQYISRANTEAK